jgi:hypothetical protein
MTDQKWQNVSAGPRQVKDLQKAISALTWEGKTHDELTGVVGGDERTSSYMSMMGPCRAEVVALDEAIRGKYNHQITRENIRAIIADYEAAIPEARKSRPTVDSRRSPEEDAEIKAKVAARDAEYQAQQNAANAVLEQVKAKAPHGAKALIVAEYHEDQSDPMTDYFNSTTTRTVAIGFRFSSREDFRALHSAAGQFPETAHLASDEAFHAWAEQNETARWLRDEPTEHRENYSMGGGNYLSDHGSKRSGTGWVVRSADLPCKWVHLTEDAIPDAPSGGNGFYDQRGNWIPQGDSAPVGAGSVTVSPSSLGREGVVEIRFADKPAPDVLDSLRARGFRWARGSRCWYGTDTEYAHSLAGSELANA